MQNSNADRSNVFAVAPVSKGFGFVFMRDRHTLLDWGARSIKNGDDKNKESLIKIEKLLEHRQPEWLVLPDAFEKGCRRQDRIRRLVTRLSLLAKRHGIAVDMVSKERVRSYFFGSGRATKFEIAQKVAERFPEQIGDYLPPERQQWMSENHFMQLFDAAAMALASFGPTQFSRGTGSD